MLCHIYRSNRKVDSYLYLSQKDDFSEVPEALLSLFGAPEFSFSFELTPEKSLARENSAEVLENLREQGYHLQLSDDLTVEQMLAIKSAN